jgi:pimeloyl-ACP methyl ester carboxylesterase
MPGTWETTEHLLSSMSNFCTMATKNQLAVIALSINQRLALTAPTTRVINKLLKDAIHRYQIPRNNIVMGGFSMGGLFSLRYTELANQDSSLTAIKPAAVFSCDGPCDLSNIYRMFQNKLKKFPDNGEAAYGINELKQYCGGTPDEAGEQYMYYSCYSHDDEKGGNAHFLLQTPIRIYADVDVNWWMDKRGVDMYYMNALDQSAMILWLKDHGNDRAAFINAYQKGYRIEGDRHPHSWSIVNPDETISWILECLR